MHNKTREALDRARLAADNLDNLIEVGLVGIGCLAGLIIALVTLPYLL